MVGWLVSAAVAVAKNSIPVFNSNSNSNSRDFNSNSIFNSTNFNSNSNSNSGIGIGIELQFQFRNWIDPNPDGGWGISYEIALRWMPLDLTDDRSTLVQVMAWCHQATSHYLSQCWPRSMSPYDVTRPQWVKGHSVPVTNCDHDRLWPLLLLDPIPGNSRPQS